MTNCLLLPSFRIAVIDEIEMHRLLRPQCFLFKSQLHDSMEDVDANVSLLQKACSEVKESRELARVLTLALNMGNVLNQGKRTGGAGGIALKLPLS